MRTRIVLVAAVFLIFSETFANVWEDRWGVGGSMTMFKMWGGVKDRSSLSYMMNVEGRYGIKPWLQVGADFGYGSFKPSREGTSVIPDLGAPYRTFLVPLNVTFKATPLPRNPVKPYVLLGGGMLSWSLRDVDDSDGSVLSKGGFVWGRKVAGQTNFGLAYGIGFEWFIKEQFALDVQGRNTHYFGVNDDNVGYGDVNDKMGELKVSALYYFGGNFDQDGDGIPDKMDVAPLDPEDFDNFQDDDGAPEPDNDNDGILDVDDAAPNEPEDMDGFQDADGAPDPDNDNDGVLDVNDKAPNVAEDLDGFQDADGIPDLDNDNDGILDANDECPDEPETVNNYKDEDGCPDQLPFKTFSDIGEEVSRNINFKTGSADLTEASFKQLDQLAQILKERSDLVIEIRGHTDNVGDAMSNQKLSEKRAIAVMDYLINKGVSPDRLKAIGLGERYPIADNSTPEGRAKNRRIEFIQIK